MPSIADAQVLISTQGCSRPRRLESRLPTYQSAGIRPVFRTHGRFISGHGPPSQSSRFRSLRPPRPSSSASWMMATAEPSRRSASEAPNGRGDPPGSPHPYLPAGFETWSGANGLQRIDSCRRNRLTRSRKRPARSRDSRSVFPCAASFRTAASDTSSFTSSGEMTDPVRNACA